MNMLMFKTCQHILMLALIYLYTKPYDKACCNNYVLSCTSFDQLINLTIHPFIIYILPVKHIV